jgi:hypothetical protein
VNILETKMNQRNLLWYLVLVVLLLLAYYLGTIIPGPAQGQPTPTPVLSNITFSDPQQNDPSLPELPEAWVSHGTYTNAELNQDFAVMVAGLSRAAVIEYGNSTKFFFEAKPSANSPGQIVPTPSANPTLAAVTGTVAPTFNAGAEFPLNFSARTMLNQNGDSLLIEFHLADETAKSFQDARQNYDLNFTIDPTITTAAQYHDYYTKYSRYYASATLNVNVTNDNVSGSGWAGLYRRISATQPGCTLVSGATVYEPGYNTASNSTDFAATYDLIIQGYTMPVTYSLSGTWSTYYDSYNPSPYLSYYCP